jgi:hypothetical protein
MSVHTSGHVDECIGQIGMIRVTACSPFEYQANGLVNEKVQDSQVDIELVFFFVFHPTGKIQVPFPRVSVTVVDVCHVYLQGAGSCVGSA